MQKINFQDLPSTDTPYNADTFNTLQNNVENAINDNQSKIGDLSYLNTVSKDNLVNAINEVDSKIEQEITDSDWINMTVLAGTPGTGYYIPQYRKKGNRVDLRGSINNVGDEGTLVFTLPEGFRPTNRIRILTVGDYLDNTMSICRILENGNIYMFRTNSSAGYLNFDCISFYTD